MDFGGYVLDRAPAPLRSIQPAGTELFHPTIAAGVSEGWVEVAGAGGSRIVRFPKDAAELSVAALPTEIEDAGTPTVSPDGNWLAFIRPIRWKRGRGQLWLRDRGAGVDRPMTDDEWDVLDVGAFPDGRAVFAGRRRNAEPDLFVIGGGIHAPEPLEVSEGPARYPAVSPDGRWVAYAAREGGNWQLWVAALEGAERRRLTSADCNGISPAWRPDSKRLVYATDCGRGLRVTALAEIHAVP
jgi:hypothetical protein